MFKHVNRESAVAAYQQIENVIRYAIASGKLKEGASLPSIREIAEQLKLNQNTVVKAMRDLEVMEILRPERGVGSFVAKGAAVKCVKLCREAITKQMHEVLCEARAAGMTKQDLNTVVQACLVANATPYAPVPASLLRLV